MCSENNEHNQNPESGLIHKITTSFSEQLIWCRIINAITYGHPQHSNFHRINSTVKC